MKRLRVDVIGLGRMGQVHARHLAELPEQVKPNLEVLP